MDKCECRACGTEVVDGVNGSVYQAPWETRPDAICYGCENEAELESDRIQNEQAALAEERYRARAY